MDNTVLVPDPVYPTYVDDNVTDGRKIIYSRTSEENGFLGTVSYTHLYNIIFAWDELNALSKESLDAARKKLADIMCNYQGFKKRCV